MKVSRCPWMRKVIPMNWRVVVLLAALVLLTGWIVRASDPAVPPDHAVLTGTVSADADEYGEGYFAIGDQTVIATRPSSPLHEWLKAHRGRRVRLVVDEAAETH